MAVHPETGALWQNEHGPLGGDEINRVEGGRNYGWPAITYGRAYSGDAITPDTAREGMEQPLLHWTPSIAPSGMAFYTGDRFPRWRGHVFVGALAGQHLRRVVFDGLEPVHQESLLTEYGQRIRDVRDGPDGYLYFLTDSARGVLGRLEPAD
jgi:glucose/arabinose dehydrogenase